MSDTLVQMEGVTKVFVTDEVETHALAGIHLELRRGEYVSISGPSGCGKSTLANTSRSRGLRAAASRRCWPFSASSTRRPTASSS
jgi:ABC-type lipoprotein export system ATPase subunit